VPAERVAETVTELRDRVRELERKIKQGSGNGAGAEVDLEAIAASAVEIGGVPVLTIAAEVADGDALLALSDRLKGRLGDAAIVLGRAGDGKVDLVASVAPAVVARGVKAGQVIKLAAAEVGGGGGGRDTMARAGGRDPDRLPEALSAARAAIEAALTD
jgi:alanyl-tRNA synthetase